ncbi:MAG: GGDEF domain-containing protein [Burkholderiales bacterium]|nr:GGDEF domain-containing protein [Burkholderiales bacterium]
MGVVALLAVIASLGLGVALIVVARRKRSLEAMQKLGPLTLAKAGDVDENARAIHAGWAQVFQQLIYSAHDVFWETDANLAYTRVLYRDRVDARFDFDPLVGHAPWESPSVGVSAAQWDELKRTLRDHRPFHDFIIGRIDAQGTLRYSAMSGVPVFDTGGGFVGYRGASRDHTAIHQTKVQLEINDAVTGVLASAARLSEALPGILEAVCRPLGWQFGARWMRDTRNNTLLCGEVWGTDSAAPLVEASRARRFPIAPHDLVTRAWTEQALIAMRDIALEPDFSRREAALAANLHAAFAFPVAVQGEVVCVLEFLSPHRQRSDASIELLARSLGGQIALFWLRREAEARLTYAATHDALTGLRNRLSFNTELERAIVRAKRNGWRLGLMFVDLDGFKQVNDRLGHQAGDTLLIDIAKRLKNSLRSSDTLARMGGDEFVILLEQTGTDGEIADIAHKLLSVIKAPYPALAGEAPVAASFGVAIYPVDAQDQQTLLAHADAAMYRAKQSRENRVVFYRPPPSEVPTFNRALDVSQAIDEARAALPATDAPGTSN